VTSLLGLYGFGYPGYSGDLPSAFFSPLGVTLHPTVLVALSLLNAAAPRVNRPLHWTLAAVAVVLGVAGAARGEWIHLPLLAAGIYAVPLLTGRARLVEPRPRTVERSVREIRNRMYSRKTLLPGPRDPRKRRIDLKRRRRRR